MYIPRLLTELIKKRILNASKVVILYGARQVGKTTLLNRIMDEIPLKSLRIDAGDARYAETLASRDTRRLKALASGYQLVAIDEAQQIPEIGASLKLMHDHIPGLKIVATGSSSFDLSNKVMEPLTGRHFSHVLYPVSCGELAALHNPFELDQLAEDLTVYGSYPEILAVSSPAEKRDYLNHLVSSYLFRDVLQVTQVRNSIKLLQLTKLLAYQIGSQVSLSELGSRLDMSKDTVARYIDLLEKSFVVFRLGGLSRNMRNEVTRMDKIYFYDLGIRNALIDDFKPFRERGDAGLLWENFIVIERLKHLSYQNRLTARYFWRLSTGAELDYVEEREGKFHAYEIKLNAKQSKPPASWTEGYPDSEYRLINRENYLSFIS